MKLAPFCIALQLLLATTGQAADISLSAAASLKEVITDLTAQYSKKHPRDRFVQNFGGSGTLAKQIAQGAPADLFIAANSEWADYLQDKGLLDPRFRDILTTTTLVFVGKPGGGPQGMADLPKLNRIAIGSPKSVPAGDYAMQAMRKAGIDRQLGAKLIMTRDVREALLYVERGEVDGAFVYRTDALQAAKRTVVRFAVPPELTPRVVYPMALTRAGAGKAEARAFFQYLQTAEAKAILTRHGFANQ